jgi:hypothetical protein
VLSFLTSLYEDCGTKFPERHPGFLPIVRQYLEWFIRSEEILVIIYRFTAALPGHCAGTSLLPFPYNEVTYAQHRSRSHDAVIRVYDDAGNVIEMHEHASDNEFVEPLHPETTTLRQMRQSRRPLTE